MVAGVLMGPSLVGLLTPSLQHGIFPPESLKILFVGAQLGVGLYMFLVGVEFRTDLFHQRLRSAAAVSVSGMVAPFVLGSALALGLVDVPGLFSERATRLEAMLFLGAAMAITALPMLARIIYERGLTGTLAVACLGKGVACWLAACWNGEDRRTGMAVGALMNARGLMELIVLNIGLQHGIIQPPLFSIMVLMAVVTTLMAAPVFELVYGRHARQLGELGAMHESLRSPARALGRRLQ